VPGALPAATRVSHHLQSCSWRVENCRRFASDPRLDALSSTTLARRHWCVRCTAAPEEPVQAPCCAVLGPGRQSGQYERPLAGRWFE
jgi:hypothetical protein